MARRFVFPDPDDRSKNDPNIIVDSQRVLDIYNQDNKGSNMQRVTQKVQKWFCDTAKENGWDGANFAGNQCLLENKKILGK